MHSLYTGVTKSGKTTLARSISRELISKGQKVIVFDPMGTGTKGGGWGTDQIYDNPWAFLTRVEHPSTVKTHLFIDEAHEILGHQMDENFWMLTKGRHFGLFLHLLTQRPNKLHPDVRSQCEKCYMFRLAADDARSIGADYGHSDIHKINLDRGDFLILNSGSAQFQRANVFNLVT